MISGIGQSAKAPHCFKCNLFNGLHGRDIPAAVGAKIANKNLIVICESGDGNTYREGGNHCVTFNKINTFQWYRERVYKLNNNYDPSDYI
jgi:pyruvate/2-oxoacid:ferredoxin oxidoreductase beta subunit